MYKHRKAQKHYFNKDCCRVIKVRGNVYESVGIKRQNNGKSNNDNSNMVTSDERDCEKTQQRGLRSHYRNRNVKVFSENQLLSTPIKDEQNFSFKKSFGQSTQVQVFGGRSSSNSKSFKFDDQDKENLDSKSQAKLLSQTQSNQQFTEMNQALPTLMQMLFEIKNQNLYLIERNMELEQVISSEIRPMIEDGFYELKNEVRDFKKKLNKNNQQQQEQQQVKKQIRVTKTTRRVSNFNAKRYQNTQLINFTSEQIKLVENENSNQDQQQVVQAVTLQVNNKLQLETGAESTFMRKLDDTVQIPPYQPDQPMGEDSMRYSVGANLLELMALGNKNDNSKNQKKQKPVKRVRNFNFRCNLNEIDKIIEEDIVNECNPTNECSNYVYSNNTSPHHKVEQINSEIRQIEKLEQLEQTVPLNLDRYQSEEKSQNNVSEGGQRPQTGGHSNKEGQNKQRKMWGVNGNRPKTGASNAPLRIGKGMINRVGGGSGSASGGTNINDNILALLSQESEELKQNQSPQIENKTEVIENKNHLSNGSDSNQHQDTEMKLEELKQNISAPIPSSKLPIQKVAQPRKRGMFKAPPSDLLEQLLLDDTVNTTQDTKQMQNNISQTPTKSQDNSNSSRNENQQNNNVKVNNFMTEQPKSRSRSRQRLVNKSNNSGKENNTKKVIGFTKQNLLASKFNLQLLDSDDETDNQVNASKKQKKGNNIGGQGNVDDDDDDDNPFQSTRTLMNLQNINEQKQKSSPPQDNANSSNEEGSSTGRAQRNRLVRQKIVQKQVKSIEELLRGDSQQQQDQDVDHQYDGDLQQQDKDSDGDQQFTKTEKEGIFFINQGKHQKQQFADNTGEFGGL